MGNFSFAYLSTIGNRKPGMTVMALVRVAVDCRGGSTSIVVVMLQVVGIASMMELAAAQRFIFPILHNTDVLRLQDVGRANNLENKFFSME